MEKALRLAQLQQQRERCSLQTRHRKLVADIRRPGPENSIAPTVPSGNRVIASDLANLRRGFARRDGPALIEMPVGPMPSPWEFILMGKVRGN